MTRKRAELTGDKARASLGAIGLLAHIGNEPESSSQCIIEDAELRRIIPNPFQPRQHFNEEHLAELADSIRQHGFYGHLWVRQKGRKYELVYGERRWRAAQAAGLETVPVEVRPLTDEQMLEIAISENVQRENLTPVEEARAYLRLKEELNYSVRGIAKKIGKSIGYVASLLSILRYPEIEAAVRDHGLPVRTAEELAKIKEDDDRNRLLSMALAGEMDRQKLIDFRRGDVAPEEPVLAEESSETGDVVEESVEEDPSVRTANTPKTPSSPTLFFSKTFRNLEKQTVETIPQENREEAIQLLEQIVSRASSLLQDLRN